MAQVVSLRKVKTYQERRQAACSDQEYHRLHRFTKEHVVWMADHFLGTRREKRGGALMPIQKIEVTLRYLANPGFQTGIAKEVGIHRSTVSKVVASTLEKIIENAPQWIVFPNTREQVARAKHEWASVRGFPCTIGAIDCTHVRIDKPQTTAFADEYINRKGYSSINVQVSVSFLFNFKNVRNLYFV
jgi:hypothetical protein